MCNVDDRDVRLLGAHSQAIDQNGLALQALCTRISAQVPEYGWVPARSSPYGS